MGEIGLDFYWETTFAEQQYEAFKIQMQWALERNMPIVIHTRNAMQEAIEYCETFCRKRIAWNFSLL